MFTHNAYFRAKEEGRTLDRPFIKNPSVITASGIWMDLTFFGRYPAANYFTDGAALTSKALYRSIDGGLDHGADKGDDYRKFLKGITALSLSAAAAPMPIMVMDYLMYYPLIAMEDTQEMINEVTLPRYQSGEGVRLMLVEQFPYIGGGQVQVTYTNSKGEGGRTTNLTTINTQTALGTIAHSNATFAGASGVFMPMAQGDGGVRSVESITFPTPDSGNLAAVLVKPLGLFGTYETTNPSEWDALRDFGIAEQIYDDAYLSAVCLPTGSLNGVIIDGTLSTYWAEK